MPRYASFPQHKPSPLRLGRVLQRHNIRLLDLSGAASKAGVDCAISSLSMLIHEHRWPTRPGRKEQLAQAITEYLRTQPGITQDELDRLFETTDGTPVRLPDPAFVSASAARAAQAAPQKKDLAGLQPDQAPSPKTRSRKANPEDLSMILGKQTLTQAARKHFRLLANPFADELIESAADVFATPDIRYVRDALWYAATKPSMLAIVGESGSGKSTIRRDLHDRIRREGSHVIIVEPHVLGMEDTNNRGAALKSRALAEAIIATLAPQEPIRASAEARNRQLHRLLIDSVRSGNHHVMVIEEAHALPIATLKHLKRFFELEDGFKKLMSIVLIGQPELRDKLSERRPEVREVVQRTEVVELPPLDRHLEAYIGHRLTRVKTTAEAIFEPGACDAIRTRLSASRPGQHGPAIYSQLYPLAVHNLLIRALNLAADLGAEKVSAHIIQEA